MATRLRRVEQVEQNGRRVLEAARRVFLKRGYAGATLEAIAEEAGFSKGVVYSQFDSKADLFFALLDQRIAERTEQNEKLVAELSSQQGLTAVLELAERLFQAEPEWSLLVIEFRVQAARDRKLNERYRKAHRRTIDGLARLLARLHERAGVAPAFPPEAMAEIVLAVGVGLALERTNDPAAFGDVSIPRIMSAALGFDESMAAKKKRRAS